MNKTDFQKRVDKVARNERLIRTARYLNLYTILLMAVCLIGCFSWVILAFAPRFFGDHTYHTIVGTLKYGSLEIMMQSYLLPDESVLDIKFYYTIISHILKLLLISGIAAVLRYMIKPLKEGTISMESLSKGFFWLMMTFIFIAIFSITELSFERYFYTAYRCSEVIFDYIPAETNDVYSFYKPVNPLPIYTVIVIVLGLFSYIFKYGAELQTQVDETL